MLFETPVARSLAQDFRRPVVARTWYVSRDRPLRMYSGDEDSNLDKHMSESPC
jgi:hypothetical protein